MGENAKKPSIRFTGFTDDWEQYKFEDIFKVSQGLQIPINSRFKVEGPNRYFYITNEFLKSSCDEKYYIENPPESVICYKNDILMTRTGNTGIVVTNVDGCFHNNFFKIQYDEKQFNKDFICQLLSTNVMHRRILNSAGSSTIPDLSHKAFYNLDSLFPNIQEQKKISEFFVRFDHFINLHQRKYDKLVKIKKSMLEKMFPQNGSDVPEIRFAGFTEAWEQRKLRDVADRYDNLRIPVAANLRVPGTTPYYGANGIQDYVDGFTHEGEFVLVAEDGANDLKNYPVKCVKGRIWVNNHAHVVQGKKNQCDNKFLAYSINRADIESLLVGGGRAKLNAEVMMGIDLLVPKYEEQKHIGIYFEQLDHLITLHQRKLEKLKNMKKSMLEKMFI